MALYLRTESVDWNRESPSYTQEYLVEAEAPLTAADTAWSYLRAFVGGWGGLAYVLPARNAATGLWANSGSFSHDVDSRGAISLTINYGIPDTETQEQNEKENGSSKQLGDLSVSTGVEAMTLEEGTYTFSEGSRDGEELQGVTPSKFIVQSTIAISKHMEVLPDLSEYVGKVNSSVLDIPGYPNIPVGFARMDSPSISKTFTTDANDRYKITFNFTVLHDHSHNEFWDGTAWSSVTPPPFETANLNLAFTEGDSE